MGCSTADTSIGIGSLRKAEKWDLEPPGAVGGLPSGGDTPLALPWTEEFLDRKGERASQDARMA